MQKCRNMRGSPLRPKMIGKQQRDQRLVRVSGGERGAHHGGQLLPLELKIMFRAAWLRRKASTGMVGASFRSLLHFHPTARCLTEQ